MVIGPIAWFIRNGVAANLLLLLIVVGGLVTIPAIRKEVFPEFSSDMISIGVVYRGAAPEEVEQAVCVRIEEAIHGLDGIKRIRSTAAEGAGSVVVELLPGADARRVLDDIKARVDAIDTFPVETEQPVVQEIILRTQVISVAVAGDADEWSMKRMGEQVRDELSNLPGITQVQLVVARPYEISIEVSESALRRYGLTFDEVARAVRRSSLDLPGGSIRTDGVNSWCGLRGRPTVRRSLSVLLCARCRTAPVCAWRMWRECWMGSRRIRRRRDLTVRRRWWCRCFGWGPERTGDFGDGEGVH
jgi:multidrug efflux pump subunit AcrB